MLKLAGRNRFRNMLKYNLVDGCKYCISGLLHCTISSLRWQMWWLYAMVLSVCLPVHSSVVFFPNAVSLALERAFSNHLRYI